MQQLCEEGFKKSLLRKQDNSKNIGEIFKETLKSKGIKVGGKINSLTVQGFEEQAEKVVDALQIFPTRWLEESARYGRVAILPTVVRPCHLWINQDGLDIYKFLPNGETLSKGDSVIFIGLNAPADISIHLFSHRLQKIFPEMQMLYQQFFEKRTKDDRNGKSLRELTGDNYLLFEEAKQGNFVNPYFGKFDTTKREYDYNYSSELMPMSFQYLLGGINLDAKKAMGDDIFQVLLALMLREKK